MTFATWCVMRRWKFRFERALAVSRAATGLPGGTAHPAPVARAGQAAGQHATGAFLKGNL